jgi:hypothetical protein
MGVEATGAEANRAANIYQMMANQALPESGLSSGSLANIEVGQTNAYNQNLLTAAGIKAGGAISGINSAVGGIQQGLGLFAGSLPKTSTSTSNFFNSSITPTNTSLLGSAGYSNTASKYPLGLYTGMSNPLGKP